jgi:hypothetical protein
MNKLTSKRAIIIGVIVIGLIVAIVVSIKRKKENYDGDDGDAEISLQPYTSLPASGPGIPAGYESVPQPPRDVLRTTSGSSESGGYYSVYYPGFEYPGYIDFGIYDVFYPITQDDAQVAALSFGEVGTAIGNKGSLFKLFQSLLDLENNLKSLKAGLPGQSEPLGFTYIFQEVKNPNKRFLVNLRKPIFDGETVKIPSYEDIFSIGLKR